mmetsp:Transcript_101957/g.297350  ORF Transcript_101957/g.297350 Transcript_101957/m.297350 type:complete len:273 (+) Transcript_101957:565-1383(+)
MGAFLLHMKKPPGEFKPMERIRGMLQAYWSRLLQHHGFIVIMDLVLTGLLFAFMGLQWFRFLGLDAKTVLTFGGISGIAFGLAAQSLVGNFISGILIRVTQPFRAGDWIEAAEVQGRVKAVTWSYTEVETKEGPTVFIPNDSMANERTSNRTRGQTRRVEATVPLMFPAGGFRDCRKLLSGLKEEVASLDAFTNCLVGEPEAHFNILGGEIATGELKVECSVRNKGLGEVDHLRSELSIAVVDHIMSKGCTVPLLEADEPSSTPAAADQAPC